MEFIGACENTGKLSDFDMIYIYIYIKEDSIWYFFFFGTLKRKPY